MKEFQVNNYIVLKLEDGKTNIYVNGSLFRQCKFLLLEIPVNQPTYLNEINSIDEASNQLDHSLEQEAEGLPLVSPEIEFWGHCSNLQVWSENDYNTKLLHSNLAFPLLKKLAEGGDIKAKRIIREEIIRRLESGYFPVIKYLIEEKFVSYINRQNLLISILGAKEAEVILELEELLGTEFRIDFTDENLEDVKYSLSFRNKKVIRIQLVGHGLKTLPDLIRKLKHIEYLYLNGNGLEELPKWIWEFRNLITLEVGSCELNSLPEIIEELESLRILNLDNNHLLELPSSIGKLTNLSELLCNLNSLRTIPENIGALKNLESLYLTENSINSIPKSIGDLKNLKILDLELNKLENLPTTIEKLVNLEKIDISGNYFKKTPEWLYNAPKIKEIKI